MARPANILVAFQDFLKKTADVETFFEPNRPYTLRAKDGREWTEHELVSKTYGLSGVTVHEVFKDMRNREVPTLSKGDEE